MSLGRKEHRPAREAILAAAQVRPVPYSVLQAASGYPLSKAKELVSNMVKGRHLHFDRATGLYSVPPPLPPPPPATCATDTTDTIPYIRLRCPFCLQNMRFSRTEGSQNVYTCTGATHAAEVRIEADTQAAQSGGRGRLASGH
jgi:hypothetical protein